MQALGSVNMSKNTEPTLLKSEGVLAEWRGMKFQRVGINQVGIDRVGVDLGWKMTGWELTYGEIFTGGNSPGW